MYVVLLSSCNANFDHCVLQDELV